MTRERAVNSTEAFHTFDPFALIEPDDPWWCDLEAHFDPDHYGVSKQLRRRYAPVKGRADFVQVGIVGHKGTGKGTLVRRALAGMSNIFPVYIDALQSFDPSDLSFGEIVLVMTRAVLTGLDTAGVQIDEAIASDLYRW